MYTVLRLLSSFFSFLPPSAGNFLAKMCGKLFYAFSKRKKGQALKNLRLVFPEKKFKELLSIVKESFCTFSVSVIELLRAEKEVGFLEKGDIDIEGKEYFDAALKDKGIFVSIHMGNWEIPNVLISRKIPYVIMVRRQKNKSLDKFLNEQRRKEGVEIVYENELRKLIRFMNMGYALGIVFDHGSRDSSIYSYFFGKKVPVPAGTLRLALHFKKKIYPICSIPKFRTGRSLRVFAPLEVKDKSDFSSVSRKLNECFENVLRNSPEGYLWWYKRFKRSKNLNITVLSDKKPGHYKQAFSLAQLIKENKPNSFIKTVELRLPYWKRRVLDCINLFSSEKCFGCFKCLRFILGPKFEDLFGYTDIVVSCGSSLSSLNRIYSYGVGARSFVVQRPNIKIEKHDLVVVPFHDKVGESKNIVNIRGSLTLTDNERLAESEAKLNSISGRYAKDAVKVGVFLGGSLSESDKPRAYVKDRILEIKNLYENGKYELFTTTSRRTPSYLEDFLCEHFNDIPLLVLANKKNYPFVSAGIKSLCDVIITSSDSISMITEAASLRPTIVFNVFGHKKSKKHKMFAEDMARNGYIEYAEPGNLNNKVNKLAVMKKRLRLLDNREVVLKALERKL